MTSHKIPLGVSRFIKSFIPFTVSGHLARWSIVLDRVNRLEKRQMKLSDHELRKESLSLRYRIRSGETVWNVLPEAYSLVREAARRTINMRHFDVQILGGIAMFKRSIVEMQTGEGKTLTATLPLYLNALTGKGALLATVNDYLANRDAELMKPIYNILGLNVGTIQTEMQPDQRRIAYQCDITYGTAKEFGFDFLRDRLLLRKIKDGDRDFLGAMLNDNSQNQNKNDEPVQREPFFALVDEADSILIDEASTPLVISAMPTDEEKRDVECYKWSAENADEFIDDVDYKFDHEKKTITLTSKGRAKVRLLKKPDSMDSVGLFNIYEFVQRAIKVKREYRRDEHYVIRDGEIVIVDEFTGRLGEGRKWRDGIHQAVEARENVEVTIATGQAARITVQDYFLRFDNLAGMTGTASASKNELGKIYRCKVIPVPTNRPPKRIKLPTRVYATESAKWQGIVREIMEIHAIGRPVLIGTRTIDKSMILSRELQAASIEHRILNAYHIEAEADIVAKAGEEGKVTVSTNMAGRGTDIKVPDKIVRLGGLHVICTEMHESARIDRQLIGRCGRQGDTGTYRQYLALDDHLIEKAYGPKKAKKYKNYGLKNPHKKYGQKYLKLFQKAQRKVERNSFRSRKTMLYYEKERKKMQHSMGQDPYLDTPD
ncbi:MAG: preprotein translocase subunit SecA [Planctomycetaceae bacterium]|jgi:preprotein translocase subunit SecA|nr:preprotein translocase subunit SecA [Planctomycetaceae bacterium]